MEGTADHQDTLGFMSLIQYLANAASHVGFADQVLVLGVQMAQTAQAPAKFIDLLDVSGWVCGVLEVSFPPGFVIGIS